MRSNPTHTSVAAKVARAQKTNKLDVSCPETSSQQQTAVLGTLVDVIEAAQKDVKLLENETAQAVNVIIGSVEAVLNDQNFAKIDHDGVLSDRLISILQACSFQDLTGQRLSRVVEALDDSHARFSKGSTSAKLNNDQKKRVSRRNTRLAHGPQVDNNAHDQGSIDALFG